MRYCWLSAVSFIASATLGNFATPRIPWHDMHVKHTWHTAPANWESLGHPPADTTIILYIALKPHQETALIDALYEVSDPSHTRYGAHLSKEQVAELVRPHPDTVELITSWLGYYGVRSSSISRTHGGAWLTVTDVLVSKANELLGASYQVYRHSKTNDTIIRTVGYSIPTVLNSHIQTVAPTTYFASTSVLRQTLRRRSFGGEVSQGEEVEVSRKPVAVLSSRNDEVTPSLLTWQYQTFAYTPAATDKNSLGILGFENEYPNRVDLTKFMTEYSNSGGGEAATFTLVQVNGGGDDPSNPGKEANTNVQYASALTYPTPIIFYSIGGTGKWSDSGEPEAGDSILELFKDLIDLPKIPQTISMSYGAHEPDLPLTYATAICKLFTQLGARGVSILVASGNEGVGKGDCKDSSGNVRFIPEFPSTCPSVTSVGGTKYKRESEIAAEISGGGFSIHFPREPYQEGAVSRYLERIGDKYAGLYNPGGRAYPDISAQALNFGIMFKGAYLVVNGGTSCSTPTAASIISLLNDYRIFKGEPPLGFLNPWLYGDGNVGFNDIKSGSNPGCKTEGFPATRGWDPVTGIGTPNFEKLQKTLKFDQAGGST
ncbi:subtilisin-like protein [Lactarius quietus]|nr:subtilisin-like protein [Lactarius quietus]